MVEDEAEDEANIIHVGVIAEIVRVEWDLEVKVEGKDQAKLQVMMEQLVALMMVHKPTNGNRVVAAITCNLAMEGVEGNSRAEKVIDVIHREEKIDLLFQVAITNVRIVITKITMIVAGVAGVKKITGAGGEEDAKRVGEEEVVKPEGEEPARTQQHPAAGSPRRPN